MLDLWNEFCGEYPQYKINIIHFEDDAYTLPTTYRTIGKHFDIIAGPILTENWKDYYRVLELGSYRFCFAVNRNHRLASRKTLSVEDLHGEKLVVVNGGRSAVIDEIRDFILRYHPEIKIKDISRHYDLEVFNRCEEIDAVLLTLEAWADVHPSLVTIPCDLNFTIPYGLMYPLYPSVEVQQFIEIVNSKNVSKAKASKL